MKVTEYTRLELAKRRQQRSLERQGYKRHETDWEVDRGSDHRNLFILDAKVSVCGKYVFTKIGKRTK